MELMGNLEFESLMEIIYQHDLGDNREEVEQYLALLLWAVKLHITSKLMITNI